MDDESLIRDWLSKHEPTRLPDGVVDGALSTELWATSRLRRKARGTPTVRGTLPRRKGGKRFKRVRPTI